MLIAVVSASVGLLTFYSPKIGLGIIVFSMLLSPRIQGGSIGDSAIHGSLETKLNDVLLAVIFCAWLGRTALIKGTAFLEKTPINLPIFLYTSICILSTILAVMRGDLRYPMRAFIYVLKYIEYFFLFMMTTNIVQTKADIRRYLWYGWITAVLVTFYGYWQIPSGGRVSAPFDSAIGSKEVANEANTFGGYYLVIFGILLGFYTQGSPILSTVSGFSLLFMMPPFFFTLSRSSYLGFTGAVLFLIGSTPRKRLNLIFGVGAIIIMILMFGQLRTAVTRRVLYTFTGGSAEDISVGGRRVNLEPSAMQRITSWRDIIMIKLPEHPLFGCGVTGVGLVDVQYPRVIGETGIAGICIFVWMLYRIWAMCWHVFKESGDWEDKALALGLITALVGILIHGMGANTFIIVRIMEPFWFLTAMITRTYLSLKSAKEIPVVAVERLA